jgi:hypothetical protein
MSGQTGSSLPSLAAWQTEVLRLTGFRTGPDSRRDLDLWRRVVGDEPEFRHVKPKVGEQQDGGPFRDGKLVLQLQSARIDWLYLPELDAADDKTTDISFPTSLAHFLPAMSEWLRDSGPINRLAFGAILRLPVLDRVVGYRQLSDLLPFTVDAETSSDFLFQINRPRSSRIVPGLKINRMCKWSVGFLVLFKPVEVNLSAPAREAVAEFDRQDDHCRIELDINTVLDPGIILETPHSGEVFHELVELGREIVRVGDHP